ncbi:hypothetical protein, partial [Brevibacterium paucivorans]
SALAAARESTPAGPKVTAAEGEALVLEMREAAETSFDLLLDAMRRSNRAISACGLRFTKPLTACSWHWHRGFATR